MCLSVVSISGGKILIPKCIKYDLLLPIYYWKTSKFVISRKVALPKEKSVICVVQTLATKSTPGGKLQIPKRSQHEFTHTLLENFKMCHCWPERGQFSKLFMVNTFFRIWPSFFVGLTSTWREWWVGRCSPRTRWVRGCPGGGRWSRGPRGSRGGRPTWVAALIGYWLTDWCSNGLSISGHHR